MRNKILSIQLILRVCASLIVLFTAAVGFAGEKTGAHLVIDRVATFGTGLDLAVSIDGSKVALVGEGSNYDGYLTPGKHTISAAVSPNREMAGPGTQTIEAKEGETYSFTAVWQGENVALVRN